MHVQKKIALSDDLFPQCHGLSDGQAPEGATPALHGHSSTFVRVCQAPVFDSEAGSHGIRVTWGFQGSLAGLAQVRGSTCPPLDHMRPAPSLRDRAEPQGDRNTVPAPNQPCAPRSPQRGRRGGGAQGRTPDEHRTSAPGSRAAEPLQRGVRGTQPPERPTGGSGNGEGRKLTTGSRAGGGKVQAGSKPTGQRAQSGGAPRTQPGGARREPATTTTQPGPGGGPLGGGPGRKSRRAGGPARRPRGLQPPGPEWPTRAAHHSLLGSRANSPGGPSKRPRVPPGHGGRDPGAPGGGDGEPPSGPGAPP